MALAAVKTFISGEVLFAADVNSMNNNILNNSLALISPLTGNLNHNNTQALSFRFENQTVTPAAGNIGRAIFQTSQNQPEIDDGVAFRRIPAVQTSTIATGDLITASTAGTWVRLAVGTSGQVLTVTSSSSIPAWGAGSGSTASLDFAKAWVVFSGVTTSSSVTPLDAFGVSTAANSIIKLSSGEYRIPWVTPFQTANYSLSGLVGMDANQGMVACMASSVGAVTSSAAHVKIRGADNGTYDPAYISIHVFGRV